MTNPLSCMTVPLNLFVRGIACFVTCPIRFCGRLVQFIPKQSGSQAVRNSSQANGSLPYLLVRERGYSQTDIPANFIEAQTNALYQKRKIPSPGGGDGRNVTERSWRVKSDVVERDQTPEAGGRRFPSVLDSRFTSVPNEEDDANRRLPSVLN
ncbi:MAG: hypothetical protein ABJO09_05490 [Hyphomicrobiales bacterium]